PGGQHLVEDDAEGELVGAAVELLPERLLRAHVMDRAHDEAVTRDGVAGRERGHLAAHHLREPEVEDAEAPVTSADEITRLDVATQDASAVRVGEAVGSL